MTHASVVEYLGAIRQRYQRGGKKEKGAMFDEAVTVTGYHRKALIRLLRRRGAARAQAAVWGGARRAFAHPVGGEWQGVPATASAVLAELTAVLERHQALRLAPALRAALLAMSTSTLERLLRPVRLREGRRPLSTTKPGSLLKAAISIRTFAEWDDQRPGFLEVDLVAHCSERTEGFYLSTLTAVDIATGWVEHQAVWGKSQERVGSALHAIGARLPFPWLGLDSDNGSEFINADLLAYCRRRHITFTRSRPYRKNDNANVEEKNWTAVRRLVGYQRYASHAALDKLNALYAVLRLHTNFFQPVMHLQGKTRQGVRVRKRYDRAQTPCQRLVAAGIPLAQKDRLAATYQRLNPMHLLAQAETLQHQLFGLAHRSAVPSPSVTPFMTQPSRLR